MATFETYALQCAASAALELLVSISNVESGMRPMSVRDGDKLTLFQTVGEGVAVAVGIADQGREPGIGLMGLTPRQLRAAGMSLQDGFDSCNALKAAAMVFGAAQANALSRGHGAATADRAAVRSWWRPDSRFASASALEAAVSQDRSQVAENLKKDIGGTLMQAVAQKPPNQPAPVVSQRTPVASTTAPDCWDIFARQRAGLTQCDTQSDSAPLAEPPKPPALARTNVASPPTER